MSDISIYVTSDLTTSERKVSPQWTVKYFQQRLELITGIAAEFQTVQLYPISNSNEYKTIIDGAQPDEITTVASLGLTPYCRIHIQDTNPQSDLKDLVDSDVPGYEMTDEDYAKRSNTVLKWKQDNQLGRFDPKVIHHQQTTHQDDAEVVTAMKIGDRCRIFSIQGERRGTIRYIGTIHQLDNGDTQWVGVEFDEPVGKNNGLIGSHQYFHCKPHHGSFVRPIKVEVGDFPELNPFDSDDEEL